MKTLLGYNNTQCSDRNCELNCSANATGESLTNKNAYSWKNIIIFSAFNTNTESNNQPPKIKTNKEKILECDNQLMEIQKLRLKLEETEKAMAKLIEEMTSDKAQAKVRWFFKTFTFNFTIVFGWSHF